MTAASSRGSVTVETELKGESLSLLRFEQDLIHGTILHDRAAMHDQDAVDDDDQSAASGQFAAQWSTS